MADYYDYSSDEEVIEFRRRNDEARKAREKARRQLFEEIEADDDIGTKRVRQLARDANSRIADEYSAVLSKNQERDRQTLEYIDDLLHKTAMPYATLRKHTAPITRYYPREEFSTEENIRDSSHSDYHASNQNTEYRFHRPYYTTRRKTSSVYSTDRPVSSTVISSEPKTSETARQRVRRIEAHLDGILDYELPSAENFKNMRHSLRDINDKVVAHKLLLDRRSDVNLDEDNRKVSERIDEKYRELEERMPCLTVSDRTRAREHRSRFDPNLIPGYITGLSVTNSEQNAELRGRIRTLLCRTRRTAGSNEDHTNAVRRRRGVTTKG
ncbi:hypothetical protein FGIG_02683 [Fasciola gigantica]|uniref:Uncharacterized protein n=1 Tax=Fasciola gigantica TaxID=46835 RepID=A0A504YJV6_FASGI|nr:hypothetical protein FGIG_02683 [Fasciola gigantica]